MLGQCLNCGNEASYTPAMICRCGKCGACLERIEENVDTEALEQIVNHAYYDPAIHKHHADRYLEFLDKQHKRRCKEAEEAAKALEESRQRLLVERVEANRKREVKARTTRHMTAFEREIERFNRLSDTLGGRLSANRALAAKKARDSSRRQFVYEWTRSDGTVKTVRASEKLDLNDGFYLYKHMRLIQEPS